VKSKTHPLSDIGDGTNEFFFVSARTRAKAGASHQRGACLPDSWFNDTPKRVLEHFRRWSPGLNQR
jgi:hypothetical protein